MKNTNYSQRIFAWIMALFLFPATAFACDYSSLVLNDVSDLGGGKYDLTMTFTAGAGYSGIGFGAAQNTWTYAFFISGATVLNYPATLTSPNTGADFTGFTVQNDSVLAYHNDYSWWACIDANCGPVQPIAKTLTIQVQGLPSQITLLGMEGAGNPAAGCMGQSVTVYPNCFPILADAGPEATVYKGYAPQECTTLTATGAGGSGSYSYLWDTGETTQSISACPNYDAHYFVTVTDVAAGGCYSIDYVKVNVVDVACNGTKVLMCKNGQTRCIRSNRVANRLNNGWVLGACSSSKNTPFEEVLTYDDLDLTAGPNPFQTQTTLRVVVPEEEVMQLQVFDLTGRLLVTLHEGSLPQGEHRFVLDREGMPAGTYLARLTTASGELLTQKLLVQ